MLERSDDNPDILKFGFSCNSFNTIMNNGGKEMLEHMYKENELPKDQYIGQTELTLAIDCSTMAKTQSK
jgi:hypothetical protein